MSFLIMLSLLFLPLLAHAEPVDTTTFAGIRVGMREADVLDRLGKPDAIQPGPRIEYRQRLGRGTTAVTEGQRYSWYYRGNSQLMSAWVYFENGVVIETQKRRE